MKTDKDIKRFEQLFFQLQPRLFAFCCKYIEDKELARDFVQECFIRFWENFYNIKSYESYLFTAVKNRCLSHLRSLKARAEYEELVKLKIKEIEISPEKSDSISEIYLKELNTLLQQSINKLPVKCKLIFTMSRYQGMKNQEIAEALEISVRTVESMIYSSLKVIKEDLQKYFS